MPDVFNTDFSKKQGGGVNGKILLSFCKTYLIEIIIKRKIVHNPVRRYEILVHRNNIVHRSSP